MKTFLKKSLQTIVGAIWHFVMTAVICYIFSRALEVSFNFKIEWYSLTFLFYATLMMVDHLKDNLTDFKSKKAVKSE